MGATYTRQSSYTDGDVVQAADSNDEFNQLAAAFAASTGHSHDGTGAEGGPVTKLLGTSITIGDATSGTDITVTFDGQSNDGVLIWMEDEDYFRFSDDILIDTTEKIQFRDTAIYINSSADGQLDIVADTEIQIAATTVDINGNVDVSGTLTVAGAVDFGDAALSNVGAVQLDSIAGDGDTDTSITFSGSNVITVANGGTGQVTFNDGSIAPVTDSDVDLGTNSLRFKDVYIDSATVTGEVAAASLDISGNVDIDGTLETDALSINSTTVTSTAAELNILDGVTATATELNLIDGVTATTEELNILDGVTATAAEINALDGITSTVAELNILDGVTAFLDEDNMASNSATGIASQQSIKAYVDTQITAEDLDITTDSGTIAIDLDSETLTVSGGTGLDSSATGNAVTLAIDSTVATLTGSQTLTNKSLTAPTLTGTAVVASLDISGDIDVDGTTNLDVVDIDGAVNIATTALVTGVLTTTATQIATGGITSGSNIVSDTDSTDDLGTNSVRWANLFVDGITATDQITATGFTGTLDGILGSGTAAAATVTTLDTSGTVNLNLVTDSSNSTSGALIVDGGVGIAKKLYVGTDLDVDGTTNLDVVDIDGAVDMATTLQVDGVATFTGRDIHSGGITIANAGQIGSVGDTDAIAIASDGVVTLTQKLIGTELDISGNIDIDGTTNLDAVDIDGAVQLDATLTIGVNDQGYDVILYGDTASANLTWDTSADDLILNGAAGLIVPDGQLTLGSTVVTSTAAELNLLDTASANSVVNSKAVIYGSSGEIAGTLSTAAQANVTSLGTLTALAVDDVAVDGKVITMTGSSSDTAVFTAGSNGTLSIVTTDAAAAAANIQITADGTAELAGTTVTLDSSGGITLDADGGTVTFADAGSSLGTITSSGYSGTSATVVVSNSTANTNFPIVFHDESNALLDDTGALRYNPSTGQLLVPNLTVAGTTTQVDTVTMEAANAVVFEGATADDHETTLTIIDPTADRTINLPNQSGTVPVLAAASNTAVTSTPEELNILDGVTSTAAELNILDGVTSTAAELNILDGVTSTAAELNALDGITAVVGELNALDIGATAVGTAVASKAVILDSNKDYTGVRNLTISGEIDAATGDFSGDVDIDGTLEADAITINGTAIASVLSPIAGGSGIVTTGALNSGSITSGFGTIDTGSSAITTTGLISGGSLDIDNVLINGTTIGHTDDTDLITVADGLVTVAGEVQMTTLDIGGTNVTSTAAELNILDGVTSTAAELNILDGVTSTAAELNILDGVTSTAAELNILDGVTSTAAELNILDGVTSTAAELNILDGVTSTAAELNILDVNNSTIGDLSEISTAADNDVLLAIDTSGGGLKKITRSAIIAGTGSSGDMANLVEDETPQLGGNLDTNSQNILIDDAHFIGDESGNEQIVFKTTGSAVNHVEITNNASGSNPILAAAGGDTNIGIALTPKGTGEIVIAAGNLNYGGAAITATGAELNLIDGGTARGTTAVADGDGILINDAGTMRMTTVQTVSAYMAAESVGGGNIVTTGALNSGTITSGFGNINTGSSTITTTGAVATGALTSGGVITGTAFTAGSAVLAEAELEMLDGITAGTVAASKAVVVDANKDVSSFRNITASATVNAVTVDLGNWTVTESSGVLIFATGGTGKMKLDASGNLTIVGDLNVNGSI
jgi:hypothetical protein